MVEGEVGERVCETGGFAVGRGGRNGGTWRKILNYAKVREGGDLGPVPVERFDGRVEVRSCHGSGTFGCETAKRTSQELIVRCLFHIRSETHLHPPYPEPRVLEHLLEVFGGEVRPDIEHEYTKVGQTSQDTAEVSRAHIQPRKPTCSGYPHRPARIAMYPCYQRWVLREKVY